MYVWQQFVFLILHGVQLFVFPIYVYDHGFAFDAHDKSKLNALRLQSFPKKSSLQFLRMYKSIQ